MDSDQQLMHGKTTMLRSSRKLVLLEDTGAQLSFIILKGICRAQSMATTLPSVEKKETLSGSPLR